MRCFTTSRSASFSGPQNGSVVRSLSTRALRAHGGHEPSIMRCEARFKAAAAPDAAAVAAASATAAAGAGGTAQARTGGGAGRQTRPPAQAATLPPVAPGPAAPRPPQLQGSPDQICFRHDLANNRPCAKLAAGTCLRRHLDTRVAQDKREFDQAKAAYQQRLPPPGGVPPPPAALPPAGRGAGRGTAAAAAPPAAAAAPRRGRGNQRR